MRSSFLLALFLPSSNLFLARMASNPWWNAACSQPPFATDSWDLSPCFQQTTLSLVPLVLLAVVGGLAFPSLATRYRNGDHPEKGGKGAYSVKLVRVL